MKVSLKSALLLIAFSCVSSSPTRLYKCDTRAGTTVLGTADLSQSSSDNPSENSSENSLSNHPKEPFNRDNMLQQSSKPLRSDDVIEFKNPLFEDNWALYQDQEIRSSNYSENKETDVGNGQKNAIPQSGNTTIKPSMGISRFGCQTGQTILMYLSVICYCYTLCRYFDPAKTDLVCNDFLRSLLETIQYFCEACVPNTCPA